MNLIKATLAFSLWLPVSIGATDIWREIGCYSTISFTPLAADFDRDIQPLFDRHCVSCHQPGGSAFAQVGMDLRPGRSYGSLVGVDSTVRPGAKRVSRFDWSSPMPGLLTDSYLWEKVGCANPRGGQRMPPPPLAALSQHEQLMIDTWISRGAAPGLEGDGREVPIQFGMTGTWYDPTLSGQGVMIEVVPSTGLFVLGWLTHARPVQPQVQGAFGAWLLGTGTVEQGSARVELEITAHPGSFDHLPSFEQVPIGSATLVFHSCTEATLHYALNLEGAVHSPRQRNMSLLRLTPNLLCEEVPADLP